MSEEEVKETPEAPPEEAPPEAPPEKPEKVEPPEGSKRWNEIYYKMKEFERQLDEKDKTLEAVIEHNKSLQGAVDGIYDKVSAHERPDPITDPEAYDKWIIAQSKRELAKEKKPPETPKPSQRMDNVQRQVGIMKSLYDDYDQVTEFAKEFVLKDPMKKNEIAFSENPPRALYEYGLEKKAALSKKRSANLDSARVEGGTPPVSNKKIELTPEQEKVRLGLGISRDAYTKQLEIIQKKRGY